MTLLDILFTLFLTHVGSLTNLKNNQRRFAPTPAHIERNHLPTSPEYALWALRLIAVMPCVYTSIVTLKLA